MPRKRKPIQSKHEGKIRVARFLHPVKNRTIRCALGNGDAADAALAQLNKVFLNREFWNALPDDITCAAVRSAWLGDLLEGVTVAGGAIDDDGRKTIIDEAAAAVLASDNRMLRGENATLRAEVKRLKVQLEHALGHKLRVGPCPSLGQAADQWLATINGDARLDDFHRGNISSCINVFVKHFGRAMELDAFEGGEGQIDQWLGSRVCTHGSRIGQPIGAGHRQMLRSTVARFLTDSGVRLDRSKIRGATALEMRKTRGSIRWLTREQAQMLATKLPEYWADAFRFQCGTGLRPSELVTVKSADFGEGLETLTLSALGNLSLKTGSRTIRISASVQDVVKRRLALGDVLFPDPSTGRPWATSERFQKEYHAELVKAGKGAKIGMKLDTRVGRRTCASLLIRSGMDAQSVAAILGNSPKMIYEHYGRILPIEVNAGAAAI